MSLFVVCFAVTSSSLMALGLGEIKLKSGLNQPLNAEITLLSVRGESNRQLIASLGSIENFERSGIERSYFLTKIRFDTITKPNGQKVLQLTTKEVVKEPFLNFLVNLEWPNGRLLREYTLLLDPPVFDEAPQVNVTPPSTSRSLPQREAETVTTPEVTRQPEWEGEIYGPTSSNDTLWGIAAKVRPGDSISMQRAMVAIFEANPDAFMKGNINYLKRGAEIRVPDANAYNDISQREALRIIAEHHSNWKSGRKTKSTVVVDTSTDDSSQTSSESTSSNSGRLSLSTDNTQRDGKGGSSSSDILIEEQNEVLKQKNETLQGRVQTDAERIEQLERLLELKDEQLANIQNRNEDENRSVTPETKTDTESTTDQSITDQQSTDIVTAETPAKPIDENPQPVADKPKPKPAKKSLMDEVMSGTYNLYLAIAGGIILLLLIISIIRRKNHGIDYKDAVAKSNTLKQKEKPDQSRLLPDVADDVLSGTDTDDFEETEIDASDSSDPLGEADIYIAYGKFDQAEKLLLSLLKEHPERMELNSKLLECYAEMRDKDKFEALVYDISSALESDSELSNYIEELYQTTWPEGKFFTSLSEANDDFSNINDLGEFEIADDFDDLYDADDSEEDVFEEDVSEEDKLEELPTTEDVFGETDDDEFDDTELEDSDVETQLDLARAYIEMGDADGTREIIAEIMETGTEEQCEEAQKILNSLEG